MIKFFVFKYKYVNKEIVMVLALSYQICIKVGQRVWTWNRYKQTHSQTKCRTVKLRQVLASLNHKTLVSLNAGRCVVALHNPHLSAERPKTASKTQLPQTLSPSVENLKFQEDEDATSTLWVTQADLCSAATTECHWRPCAAESVGKGH